MPTIIRAPNGHKVKAAVSHAVRTGNLLFISGTPGYFGDRELAVGDFPAQFHQAMKNLKVTLESSGTDLAHVVKMTVYLTRQSDFWTMDDLYRRYFPNEAYPARTTIITMLMNADMLLEIEAVAEV